MFWNFQKNGVWAPTSAAGLKTWIDFGQTATITPSSISDNTVITDISDLSGNSQNWTKQTTGTSVAGFKWRSNILNGFGVARQNSNSGMTSVLAADLNAFSFGMLVNFSALSQFDLLFSAYGGANYPTHQMSFEVGSSSNRLDWFEGGVGATASTGAASITTGTWYNLFGSYSNLTDSGNIYIGNVSLGSTSVTSGLLNKTLGLGWDGGAGFTRFRGDMACFALWDNVLSTADRNAWYAYTLARWGV